MNIPNSTDLNEVQSAPDNDMLIGKPETHRFSRKLATQYGISSAILLGYLANRITAIEGKCKDGKGFYISVAKLAERYPYFTASGIAKTLARLRKLNVLKTANHNQRKYDFTLWYQFVDSNVQAEASADPVRFESVDAIAHGVPAALLLTNLRYQLAEHRKTVPTYEWHRISPATIAKHLPVSERTLRRALNDLVTSGVLQRRKGEWLDHAGLYSFTKSQIDDRSKRMNSMSEGQPEQPNGINGQPESKYVQPKRRDYTLLEDFVVKNLLEDGVVKTFKDQPAPLSGVRMSSNTHVPNAPDQGVESSAPTILAAGLDSGAKNEATKGVLANAIKAVEEVRPSSSAANSRKTAADANVSFNPFLTLPAKFKTNQTHDERKAWLEDYRNREMMEERCKLEAKKRQQDFIRKQYEKYELRQKTYRNPYTEKEAVKDLLPEEKVRVLKGALRSMQKTGVMDGDMEYHHEVGLICPRQGYELAQQFFKMNPEVTVSDITGMIEMCCQVAIRFPEDRNQGAYDPYFYERRASNLTFFFKHLNIINTKLGLLTLGPEVVYLDDEKKEEVVEVLDQAIIDMNK